MSTSRTPFGTTVARTAWPSSGLAGRDELPKEPPKVRRKAYRDRRWDCTTGLALAKAYLVRHISSALKYETGGFDPACSAGDKGPKAAKAEIIT